MENESQKKINENTCKELYIKAHNIIKNAKIQKYAKEGEEIATQGITFFGGINGKNALQLEKMRNVKLRIELTQSQKPEFKDKYESKDIMADLYVCAISELAGNFTSEMKNMYNKIKEEADTEDVSDENIYKIACKKMQNSQSYLPIIHQEKSKGIFGDIKSQIEFYKLENKKLENEIVLERGKSQFETFSSDNKIIPVSINFNKNKNKN